jgi:hypothetical protein
VPLRKDEEEGTGREMARSRLPSAPPGSPQGCPRQGVTDFGNPGLQARDVRRDDDRGCACGRTRNWIRQWNAMPLPRPERGLRRSWGQGIPEADPGVVHGRGARLRRLRLGEDPREVLVVERQGHGGTRSPAFPLLPGDRGAGGNRARGDGTLSVPAVPEAPCPPSAVANPPAAVARLRAAAWGGRSPWPQGHGHCRRIPPVADLEKVPRRG